LQLQQAATIKHKASHARLAQLLQPSLAFCFSQNKMIMTAAAVVQVLHEKNSTDWKWMGRVKGKRGEVGI